VCTDFKMLQVKVPITFFGTPVFSARRDGRYLRGASEGVRGFHTMNLIQKNIQNFLVPI
jgi:hypothetical protein